MKLLKVIDIKKFATYSYNHFYLRAPYKAYFLSYFKYNTQKQLKCMFTLLFLFPIYKTNLPKLILWIQKTIITKHKYMI